MSTPQSQLEQINRRVEQANLRRQRVQVQLEAGRQQYNTAVAHAQETFGSADLDTLRAQLVALETANATAIADCERALADFEDFITRIEAALNNPEAMAALVNSINAAAPTTGTPTDDDEALI